MKYNKAHIHSIFDKRLKEIDNEYLTSYVNMRKYLIYKLSRYACYIVIQNADSSKKAVALAKTYIVAQTRKRESNENNYKLAEDLFMMTLREQSLKTIG